MSSLISFCRLSSGPVSHFPFRYRLYPLASQPTYLSEPASHIKNHASKIRYPNRFTGCRLLVLFVSPVSSWILSSSSLFNATGRPPSHPLNACCAFGSWNTHHPSPRQRDLLLCTSPILTTRSNSHDVPARIRLEPVRVGSITFIQDSVGPVTSERRRRQGPHGSITVSSHPKQDSIMTADSLCADWMFELNAVRLVSDN